MKEILLFTAGGKHFGLELPLIIGIHRAIPSMMKQDGNNATYMINDADVPLCDFSEVLGEKGGNTGGKKIVLVSVCNRAMALMVDRVDRVVSARSEQIELLPSIFKGKAAEWFPKVLWHEERPFLLLNPDGMGYVRHPVLPEGLESMVNQIVREDAVADILVRGLSQALKTSVAHGVERIRDILEGHDRKT
jgi:chemotaxis signal transduction protein